MNRLTPFHHHSGDPLFDVETRRALWRDARTLVRRSLTRIISTGIVAFSILVIVWLLLFSPFPDLSGFYSLSTLYLLFSLTLASLWLDVACLRASIHAINGEFASGRWDLLRLTPIRLQAILNAKHGAAQVRAWSTLASVIGLRSALLPIMVLWVLFLLNQVANGGGSPISIQPGYLLSLIYTAAFALLLLLEPVWRMRAMTAVGLAASAQVREASGAWLLGLAGVFAFWLGEGVVLLGIGIGWGLFSFMFSLGSSWLAILCLAPAGLAIFSLAAYGYYLVVRTWALRRAARRLANLEG